MNENDLVGAVAAAESRVARAQANLSAARLSSKRKSMHRLEYVLMCAERDLTKARHADEYGDCRCALCRGVVSWDD